MKVISATLFEQQKPRRRKPAPSITATEAPQIIKYMGSKAQILAFVIDGINRVYEGNGVCDLFAGSAILSGAIGRSARVFSNDIQAYSRALSGFYLTAWRDPKRFVTAADILLEAEHLVAQRLRALPAGVDYDTVTTLREFNEIEERNREMISRTFDYKFHLFVKFYSGTWWSARQCVWIDALREVAERYVGQPHHDLAMVALLHAMAYCGSGTGHYAQYRDAKTMSSMKDIATYRRRSLKDYFARKYSSLADYLPTKAPAFKHEITSLDYRERLTTLPRCTVYADPPYAFVHYSRFYHAIETVYLYDFPDLQVKCGQIVKGRYREGRHQSPFCIRTQVPQAFADLFAGVASSGSNLVLSYSNTGMIGRDDLFDLAKNRLPGYAISTLSADHQHMTMGRRADRHRDVEEVLVLAKAR